MIQYLTINQIIQIHGFFLNEHGGLSGIRDKSILESAVKAPKATFDEKELYPSLFDKASVYLLHIVRGHPFFDGNKRAAAGASLMFLRANGIPFKYEKDHFVNFILSIAEGKISKEEIATYFQSRS
jgi:death-on-curing protein